MLIDITSTPSSSLLSLLRVFPVEVPVASDIGSDRADGVDPQLRLGLQVLTQGGDVASWARPSRSTPRAWTMARSQNAGLFKYSPR